MTNLLNDLGFQVVDNDSVRHHLERERDNAQRYRNAEELTNALGQMDAVDLVVHMNVSDDSGERKLIARLIDVDADRTLGTERWPNRAADRLAAYPVSTDDPEDVARFIVGRMMARWDRLAQRSLATTGRCERRGVEDLELAPAVVGVLVARKVHHLRQPVPRLRERPRLAARGIGDGRARPVALELTRLDASSWNPPIDRYSQEHRHLNR